MNFEEHAAKPLLEAGGITIPKASLASDVEQVVQAQAALGGVVVKAQVPTGKRGKAGGIVAVDDEAQARAAAEKILGMEIAGHHVERVLVEQRADIAAELYAAVLNDAQSKGPLLIFSAEGGMDIEELAATKPDAVRRVAIDISQGLTLAQAREAVGAHTDQQAIAETLVKLYDVYIANDAELLEINPLAILADGRLCALDCKFVLDDSAVKRREQLAKLGAPERYTALEQTALGLGLKFIELEGNIGVLANGAGLTMTTMDVISHHGARPANFLEIGGEAYTLAKPALELVLSNPSVKSLVVNFCGAFARTDVMTEGVIKAWQELNPSIPIFFSVHGTGALRAREMLKEELKIVPFGTMDEAVIAAIAAGSRGEPA